MLGLGTGKRGGVVTARGFTLAEVIIAMLVLSLVIFGVGGYVLNIVEFAGVDFSAPVVGMTILRGVGILMFPLGMVLGWL